jgi:hypothetical protein
MLFRLGWKRTDADTQFCESEKVRNLNRQILDGLIDNRAILEAIEALERPFAIKEPRFALTLHNWARGFKKCRPPPLLVHLTRNLDDVFASYKFRGELVNGKPGAHGKLVGELAQAASGQYTKWPFSKVHIAYEDLKNAVEVFSLMPRKRNLVGGL